MKKINLKDFALHFCKSRNAEESAIAVGVSPAAAKIEGLKLLSRKSVLNRVRTEQKVAQPAENAVIAGLERLAFGRTNDAAALVFSEEVTPHQLVRADLYNVSEIKKIKGGGVEIKFFDRQKALERLWEYNEKVRSRQNANLLAQVLCSDDEDELSTSDGLVGDDTE